jgi:hypothetical protein
MGLKISARFDECQLIRDFIRNVVQFFRLIQRTFED